MASHPECLRRLSDTLDYYTLRGWLEHRPDIARRSASTKEAVKNQLPPCSSCAFCCQGIDWEALLSYQREIEASRLGVCVFREWVLSGMCAPCQREAFPFDDEYEDSEEEAVAPARSSEDD